MNSSSRSLIASLFRSQYSVIGNPGTYSITKYGWPCGVVPASKTLAMAGWSMMASDCRSDRNRCTTVWSYIPALISFSATGRCTGPVCSASQTCPMPPSPSLRISRKRSAKISPACRPSVEPNSSRSAPSPSANAEDCRKLAGTSSPEARSASTSWRRDSSDKQAESRKAERSPGANSSARSSTSRICCQRSGFIALLRCSSRDGAKGGPWPNVSSPLSEID